MSTPSPPNSTIVDISVSETPGPNHRLNRSKTASSSTGKATTLTLRDQEKHIDNLNKENFNIKLRVHFLEERLAQLAPDQIDAALKQNINLKVEVHQRGMEIKKLKKLVLSLERELERLQQQQQHQQQYASGGGGGKSVGYSDDAELREVEARNAILEEDLENTRGLLQENLEQIDRLREIVEGRESGSDTLGDKYAALVIELQQREDELELKGREVDELVTEHQRIVEVVEEEWKGEVEEARTQVEELRDVLAEREIECKDLRMTITELEANTDDLHTKYEAAFANLEEQIDQKDVDLEHLQETIDRLGEQVYHLEDENERLKEEHQRLREDEEAERERLEALVVAFKDKSASLKDEVQQMTAMYDTCSQEIHAHRSRQEELAQHVEHLVDEVQRERTAREALDADLDSAEKEHDAALRREKRTLEAKELALQNALGDLTRAQSLLSQRERDLEAVQSALQTFETESKRIGETHTTARFSLQLEADRLKRDLERVEDELSRARKELDDKDARHRERDSVLDKLHAENLELSTQLGAQTQARLNLSEKLDLTMTNLRNVESDSVGFKTKIADLEQRLSKDQRSLLNAEGQYRDQLTERNTLLLTIYQYLDKILGVDKTPKTGGQAETKPFTNFSIFHDNLITRLKALSQIQVDFEKRCKEAEARFSERINDMRKQLDNRWRQIDKFEGSLKTYGETKAGWKKKLNQREGEVDALKSTNSDLAAQLASLRRPTGSDSTELRSLTARAQNAERRLNNAQNQLLSTEEKLAAVSQKTGLADSKWEARVKEYEARLKAAEERVKRERQGSKERVLELENSLKSLQRQLDLAQKRNAQLDELTDGPSDPTR